MFGLAGRLPQIEKGMQVDFIRADSNWQVLTRRDCHGGRRKFDNRYSFGDIFLMEYSDTIRIMHSNVSKADHWGGGIVRNQECCALQYCDFFGSNFTVGIRSAMVCIHF